MGDFLAGVKWTCTICDAPMGTCDCWTPCECGWQFRTGQTCNNPVHRPEFAASERRARSVSNDAWADSVRRPKSEADTERVGHTAKSEPSSGSPRDDRSTL